MIFYDFEHKQRLWFHVISEISTRYIAWQLLEEGVGRVEGRLPGAVALTTATTPHINC